METIDEYSILKYHASCILVIIYSHHRTDVAFSPFELVQLRKGTIGLSKLHMSYHPKQSHDPTHSILPPIIVIPNIIDLASCNAMNKKRNAEGRALTNYNNQENSEATAGTRSNCSSGTITSFANDPLPKIFSNY